MLILRKSLSIIYKKKTNVLAEQVITPGIEDLGRIPQYNYQLNKKNKSFGFKSVMFKLGTLTEIYNA